MRDRTLLDWRVPEAEWERFVEHVENEFGSIEGYLGREAEAAMREYADTDGYAGVEERVDRLVKAAGRSSDGGSEEKNSQFNGVPTTRVTVRVDPDVKDDFRAAAKKSDQSYGVTFARAIQTYRDGGRAARLERRLDRVLDDAEKMLEQVAEDSDDDSVSMGKHQRCVIAICNELGEEFVDDELERAIRNIANVHSEKSIRDYRQDVIERLDVEPHPNVPHLWVQPEKAERLCPGVPKECRRPVEHLSSDDRVRRLKLAAGRRAASTDAGKIRVTATEIREQVFDNETSRKTTRELMRSASQTTTGVGFDGETSPAALQVNLRVLGETEFDLWDDIIDYRDNTDSGLLSSSAPTTMDDFVSSPDEASSGGQPAASDGGEDGPW
ncbi:hypothetical protein C5B90_19285 [Haloferax sp. Atlit-12N]|uniref:hypothetical protein n=1 Tax=Haloferax sp. Atlit-12N TaxID=2077203 RepID=UPI000E27E76F|nr:hypothetical protein [Haloferax sp. Atlit-12N]RDZ61416.1 hypothetical protein C5B90_19285 [Haloferax sp. Atlit-12N]